MSSNMAAAVNCFDKDAKSNKERESIRLFGIFLVFNDLYPPEY